MEVSMAEKLPPSPRESLSHIFVFPHPGPGACRQRFSMFHASLDLLSQNMVVSRYVDVFPWPYIWRRPTAPGAFLLLAANVSLVFFNGRFFTIRQSSLRAQRREEEKKFKWRLQFHSWRRHSLGSMNRSTDDNFGCRRVIDCTFSTLHCS
jgi:hypothetical protein